MSEQCTFYTGTVYTLKHSPKTKLQDIIYFGERPYTAHVYYNILFRPPHPPSPLTPTLFLFPNLYYMDGIVLLKCTATKE